MTEYPMMINGIRVTAQYSERAIDEIFMPLLRRLAALQQQRNRRILVLLAAPPGCGKTTLACFLEKLSREGKGLTPIQTIGMDGFHRRQEYLQSHFIERRGMRIPMVDVKGAPITFDLQRLTDSVRRAASGEICGWPAYDRILHNPVEDALRVDGSIILLEGNYLLLDEDGWRDLRRYADYSISITAGEALLRSRLIGRRIRTGVEKEKAVRFVDGSDMPNARLCLEKTLTADLSLRMDDAGDYHLQEQEKIKCSTITI